MSAVVASVAAGAAMPALSVPAISWGDIFSFQDYAALLALVQNSLIAGAVLGLVGGLIGVFVMQRDLAFAVHGVSELSFAGAAAALLFGLNVVAGSLVGAMVAAALIGVLGARARDRNSIIGVLMPFGLGLGILFLSLYDGRSANRFSLLTGQIISVDTPDLVWLIGISIAVLIALLLVWRPLRFDSLDAASAAALFGFVSAVGGILLAIAGTLPVSPYITTISFLIYVVCRIVAWQRSRVSRVVAG